jgi:hypothetical protein
MDQDRYACARRNGAQAFLEEGLLEHLLLSVSVSFGFEPQPATGAEFQEKIARDLLLVIPFAQIGGEAFGQELLEAPEIFIYLCRYSEIHVKALLPRNKCWTGILRVIFRTGKFPFRMEPSYACPAAQYGRVKIRADLVMGLRPGQTQSNYGIRERPSNPLYSMLSCNKKVKFDYA